MWGLGRPQSTGVFILLKIAHPGAISIELGKQSHIFSLFSALLCSDRLIKIVDNTLKKSWDIFTCKPHLEWAWSRVAGVGGWMRSGGDGREAGWLGGPGRAEGRAQPREDTLGREAVLSPVSTSQDQHTEAAPSGHPPPLPWTWQFPRPCWPQPQPSTPFPPPSRAPGAWAGEEVGTGHTSGLD